MKDDSKVGEEGPRALSEDDKKYYRDEASKYGDWSISECDKFDNRLFWVSGGTVAVSLAYFQATKVVFDHSLLLAGYIFLILCISVMLAGLQFSYTTNTRWRKFYLDYMSEDFNQDESDKEYVKLIRNSKCITPVFNIAALLFVIAGMILVLICMVSSQPQ